MRAVVQRVGRAAVRVAAESYEASIGRGFCVLLGVEVGDTEADARWMAGKLARLRIFPDDEGRMNRDLAAVHGSILLVSQFTLAGECARGNRPSFIGAAAPELGCALYELVGRLLESEHGVTVRTGIFGATMEVELVNEGPVTLIVRTPDRD